MVAMHMTAILMVYAVMKAHLPIGEPQREIRAARVVPTAAAEVTAASVVAEAMARAAAAEAAAAEAAKAAVEPALQLVLRRHPRKVQEALAPSAAPGARRAQSQQAQCKQRSAEQE